MNPDHPDATAFAITQKRTRDLFKEIQMKKAIIKNHYCHGDFINGGYDCLLDMHGISWVRSCLLGTGATAAVYFAKRRVPVKKDCALPPEMAVKSATMNRASPLMNEKRILCRLASPYVVTCYGDEVIETNDGKKVYNVILEYCRGSSLEYHIKNSPAGLTEDEVRVYTRHIVEGLHYIHSRGIVHCDIKPANILLGLQRGKERRFIAKIADFGTAVDTYGSSEVSGAGHLKGTHRYMSPEMVREKKLGVAGDIWALGCVVVEMVSGKKVWNSEDDGAEINQRQLLKKIGFSSSIPEIPMKISEMGKDFLLKCLVRSVEGRWSSEKLLQHPFLKVDSSPSTHDQRKERMNMFKFFSRWGR